MTVYCLGYYTNRDQLTFTLSDFVQFVFNMLKNNENNSLPINPVNTVI